MNIWLVSFGGAVGAWLRYVITGVMAKHSTSFPWGTWVINLAGSMLLGILAGLHQTMPDYIYAWLGIGFCGAFTTFSTFTVESWLLIQQRRIKTALTYIGSTALFNLAAAVIGLYVIRLILQG
ncbi:fluoride efflux transporter CrcB [Paenibacillus sp. ACRRX]|uniref:fluoride efflux transporter CrcB n=1 Tax=Paenibacillus sp. ACRRX TaxID=2918206 RepID=UPI001EF461EB|nr:fluoride efflux transporter CrcB [Paenibacillus sp. ACRRX]MCG7410326.1 fluoride efflux transporter CrcB [Paenibacillus sp. ACRRX]